MAQAVITNPVINSPYEEPGHHYVFDDDGITDQIATIRRLSSYFVPIAQPKKKARVAQQPVLFDEFTRDRIKENDFINQIRARVSLWRQGGYKGVTKTTRLLLDYWINPERQRRLFFCQIEALETAIYLTEVAPQIGDNWIHNRLVERNDECNPDLFRVAFKLATGSGKTLVAAMLIAWQSLNKLVDQQNKRFSDAFLIVAPGIPVRDRLRVLLPSDPNNYYQEHDLVPADMLEDLGQAAIVVTNYHAFLRRERVAAGKLTKSILAQGENSAFTETLDQMVRRVCRELGAKKNIVVINDEAHHCYRDKPDDGVVLKGEDLQEAKKRNEEAHTWITGIEAVKAKMAHYNDSCKNGPCGLLPAQLHCRHTFWRDKSLNSIGHTVVAWRTAPVRPITGAVSV